KTEGNAQDEARHLDRALKLSSPSWEHGRLQRLCDQLEEASRFSDALVVYRHFCRTDRLTAHTRLMLRCAERAGEHKFVIDTLASLRDSGQSNIALLRIEAQLATRYREDDTLVKVLQAAIKAAPQDPAWV